MLATNSMKYSTGIEEEEEDEGSFVIEETSRGKYEGFKVEGLRSGVGRMFFPEGGWYEGQWQRDKMSGFGKMYYSDSKLAYEGHWSNDKFNGTGTVYNDKPSPTRSGNIDYRDFSLLKERWSSYEGDF